MTVTDSRLALYEALIALAWVDHTLDPREKETLHDLIDGNLYFDDGQRQALHLGVDTPVALDAVWPRLTDGQDRARLVDWANAIFASDGEVCDDEHEVGVRLLERHLRTLDRERVAADQAALGEEQRIRAAEEAKALRAYRRQFSLAGAIRRVFTQDPRPVAGG